MKNNILIKPIISEKTMQEAAKNRYTFSVAIEASKDQIKSVIDKIYGVTTKTIKTVTVKGEFKRVGKSRNLKKSADCKKAIIELPAGQKIDIFDKNA